ncbi:MAG: hypothetical protein GXO74_16760 [Calditrichaeota bacterium]|nr:hypothetical protein [Calditrichota bacterium]
MDAKLSLNEKRYLDEFLTSVNDKKLFSGFSCFYASAISVLGLILLVATVIITLGNLNNRVVYWVFLPGVIGGIGIILLGIFLLKYLKKIEEQKKLAAVIEKLLNT